MQNDEDRKKRRKGVKPTMLDQSYYETANEIISRYPLEEKSLIPIIQDIQATYRYLPPDLLDYVAKKIGITETKAYSVASFYENFSFEQKGKYVLKICDGTACHVRKSTPVLQYLRQELGLSETKQTTDDLMFTVEVVSCLDFPAPAQFYGLFVLQGKGQFLCKDRHFPLFPGEQFFVPADCPAIRLSADESLSVIRFSGPQAPVR